MQPRRFVYVLQSARDPERHYVGVTSDVAARLAEHNSGRSPHTFRHRPWTLLMSVEFASAGAASRFERYLKSGSGRAFAMRRF
jgi:predicted GIY-YIG superfamily endonuclease